MRILALLCLMATANALTVLAPNSFGRASGSLARQEGTTPTEVFRGTVYSNAGRLVLRVESRRVWYQLDDQRSSRPFEGKEVRVIGTLDVSTKTIYVVSIEEDPVHSGFSQAAQFLQSPTIE